MDRRQNLLINDGEVATDAALQEAAASHGVRVFPKARMASALRIERSGLSSADYSYALKSELDFVIGDATTGQPHFAVEFDEPHHLTDQRTIERDRRKEAICDRLGLPLLRIGYAALARKRQYTVVGWLLETFFLEQGFYEAQSRGEIPNDEPFCYFSVFDPGDKTWFALDSEARALMVQACRAGHAPWHVPETVTTDSFRQQLEVVESYCIFCLDNQRYIIGRARLRNFRHFAGLTAKELVTDLAVDACGQDLRRYLRGDLVPASAEQLAAVRERTDGWCCTGTPVGNAIGLRSSPLSPAS